VAVASCLAAFLGAQLRPALAQAAVPADFFGLYSEDALWPEQTWRDLIFSSQVDAGAGLVRLPFYWNGTEPLQGWWQFDQVDGFMIAAARNHMHVLPTLVGTPEWASSAPARAVDRSNYPPGNLDDMRRYARHVVERYGPDGVFWRGHPELDYQPIREWQVWNEPNIPSFWPEGPDPAAYTKLLIAAGDAIHAADPGAKVVSAGITDSRLGMSLSQFLKGMYLAGAKGHFDLLGVHPYEDSANASLDQLDKARAIMDSYGDDSPIWATEFGWASGGDASPHTTDEAGQAAQVESALRQMVAARTRLRLRGIIYYNWHDSISSTPGAGSWPAHAGLLRLDGTRKPAYYAYRRVALDSSESLPPPPATDPPAAPAAGSAPPGDGAGESSSPAPRPFLRVTSPPVVTLGSGGRLRLRVECVAVPGPGSRCAGGIRLERRSKGHAPVVLSRRHYQLAAGRTASLRLTLVANGRRMLVASRRVGVTGVFIGTPADHRVRLTLVRKP
jgi:hypothetical protein